MDLIDLNFDVIKDVNADGKNYVDGPVVEEDSVYVIETGLIISFGSNGFRPLDF